MAHNFESGVFAGKRAWHGLGVVVEDAPTPEEALRLGGLDWRVEKRPALCRVETMSMDGVGEVEREVPGAFAMVRTDNGSPLGIVGNQYTAWQNRELAQIAQDVADGVGDECKVESAISLRGGRDVAILVRARAWSLGTDDPTRDYLLLHNSHDGTGSLTARPTSVRVVCSNTLGMAMRDRASMSIRHTANIGSAVQRGIRGLVGAREASMAWEEDARRMAGRGLSSAEAGTMVAGMVEALYGKAPEESDAKARHRRKAEDLAYSMQRILSSKTSRTDACKSASGAPTAWAVFNAFTEHVDHKATVRGERKDPEKRTIHRLMSPTTIKVKDAARELVLATC